MRILLVSPINRTYVIMPPLGLGYLASSVRKRHSVSILDCKKEGMGYKGFSVYIKNNKFDLIGFQVFSYDINSVIKHIEIIRHLRGNSVTIVAGGPHPSGLAHTIFDDIPGLDFAFKGESEIGFAKFVEYLHSSSFSDKGGRYKAMSEVPGLIFRNAENKIVINDSEFVEDLDSVGLPSWDLMNPASYPDAPHGAFARAFPTAPMIITRGCPSLCTFCAGKSISGHKIRKRSIANVWTEVEYLVDRFGVKEILIEDENFTLHRELLNDFCIRMINYKQKISWSFPAGVRLDTLNADNVCLMEEAGCYSMAVGIEFGSQKIHDLTKKRLTIELIEEKIALLSQSKIKVTGFFLMGIPGETKEDILSTINFANRLDIDRAQFNNFMPLPGSELWSELAQKNKLRNINWDRFFVHDVAYVLDGISRKELKRLQRRAYLRFYLRLKIICKLLKEIRSFGHSKMLLKRFIDSLS